MYALSDREFLRRVRRLVGNGWTKHAYARDKSRHGVNSMCPSAVCWCLGGAARRANGGGPETAVNLAKLLKVDSLPAWNDAHERTKEEVLARIDEAIGRLR